MSSLKGSFLPGHVMSIPKRELHRQILVTASKFFLKTLLVTLFKKKIILSTGISYKEIFNSNENMQNITVCIFEELIFKVREVSHYGLQ